MRGSSVITLDNGAPQSFSTDATTGEPPISTMVAFAGTTHYDLGGVLLVSGGSGYDDGITPSTFDVTLVGGTGTAAIVNVTTDGLGTIVLINSITLAGDYTVLPSDPVSTTGDDGTHHGIGLTFDAAFTVISGATVTLWNDQSGNANNGVQATSARQPFWFPSASGGKPGISFDGDLQQFLTTLANVALPNSEIYAYAVITDGSAYSPFMGCNVQGSVAGFSFGLPGGITAMLENAYDAGSTNTAGGNSDINVVNPYRPVLMEFTIKFGGSVLTANGADVPITNNNDFGGPYGAISSISGIGADDADIAHADFAYCTICELVIYPTIPSDPNQLALRQNTTSYYGIALP
jgi:hypothetical protein